MLSPRYLDGLSDEIIEIYSQLETEILQDMARRLARLGKVTDATRWQAQMLAEAGGLKKNVSRILAKYDKEIVRQITDTFTEALETNARNDNRIFSEATGRMVSTPNAQAMLSTIQKCHSDLSRLTLTTAATTQTQFVQQANRAYMMTQSGAFDYDTAMKEAADALAKRGITTVQYENGKPVTRTIESAVRMNILTSVSQTAANQTLNNCEVLDCDLVETSAHIGSRPEHEEWQGRIFSRSGNSEKYRPFSVCGLGSPTGICGINCRHSFYPYFEGMERHYTQDDLDEMAGEKVSFNGQEMTRYEGEQKLRGMERKIRAYKRLALTEEAAGADNTAARRKLGEWQAAARDFTKQTGIARDSARERVGTPTGKQPTALKPLMKNTTPSATSIIPETISAITSYENAETIKNFAFYTTDLRENDKKIFLTEYSKANADFKIFVNKYGSQMRMNCYQESNGYYSPLDNKIHFNINNPRQESLYYGFTKNMCTYFHEFGHWLDYNALGNGKAIRDELPKLKNLLVSDVLNYTNNFIKNTGSNIKIKNFERNTSEEKFYFRKIKDDIFSKYIDNQNVSDIFEGVTNAKIVDGAYHGKMYWKRPQQLEKEAIAEMFETMATGGTRREAMLKYFPTAFNYFESYIKGLLK